MFFIYNFFGKVIGFGGCILVKDVKVLKYVNMLEMEVYNKSWVFYGVFYVKQAICKCDECILVEGYIDVIFLYQVDVKNVVVFLGILFIVG